MAGEPVKPSQIPGSTNVRHVLLPVRKTAKGDPNYPVVLKYGGTLPPLAAMATVQFPLVRTVKPYPAAGRTIGIEQSQVEIYVPKSHEWFNFGGKMHQTADEADLAAGRLSAFNRQGERLIEAARDSDAFTRIRTGQTSGIGSPRPRRRPRRSRERPPGASSKTTSSWKARSPITPAWPNRRRTS